jgi:hypothetical protein
MESMTEMKTTEGNYINCIGEEVCDYLRRAYIPSDVRTKLLDDMNHLMKDRKKIECSMAKDLYEKQEQSALYVKLKNKRNALVSDVNRLLRVLATDENKIDLEKYCYGPINPTEQHMDLLKSGVFRLKQKRLELLDAHKRQLFPEN